MYVGGVHSIIHMMEKYNSNTDVLQHGCTALGTFASHGNLNPYLIYTSFNAFANGVDPDQVAFVRAA